MPSNFNSADQILNDSFNEDLQALRFVPADPDAASETTSTNKDAGSVTKALVKNSAGNVYSFYVTNTNSAVRYFQLHNKSTAPAGTDTAQLYFVIPGGSVAQPSVLEIDTRFFAPSEYFTTGIGWAVSTTSTAFTDSATASEHLVIVRYK